MKDNPPGNVDDAWKAVPSDDTDVRVGVDDVVECEELLSLAAESHTRGLEDVNANVSTKDETQGQFNVSINTAMAATSGVAIINDNRKRYS